MSDSEELVTDALGRLMDFWGFKRNMGRIWALLYLNDHPLSAVELRERLKMSAGAVSMAANELMRWGVVKKVWMQGERRDYFQAENDLWKMVSRVFRERELTLVKESITALEDALHELKADLSSPSQDKRARARMQSERIQKLLDLARLGHTLISTLLDTTRLDARPLASFLLGRK